jgi:protein FRA10AC1
VEQGESKSALVKVVLCPRCLKKLMWKRRKEKEMALEQNSGEPSNNTLHSENGGMPALQQNIKTEEVDVEVGTHRPVHRQENPIDEGRRRRRSSRSRSPRHRYKTTMSSRRRDQD